MSIDTQAFQWSGKRRQHSQQGFATKGQALAALREVIAETEPPSPGPMEARFPAGTGGAGSATGSICKAGSPKTGKSSR